MKAYVESYGCAHNEADARVIKGILLERGATLLDAPKGADAVFLVTCGVKHTTEMRMITRVRELLKTKARLIVCGCLPKINEPALRAAGATEFLDTDSLHSVPDALEGKPVPFSTAREDKHSLPCEQGDIAVIQVSEGCLGNCAFCGTKRARGSLHSYPLHDIVRSCERALQGGSRELWLASEDTGVYGADIRSSLPELIRAVVSLKGAFRVRVGMMNPNAAKRCLPELLDAFDDGKVFKFAHVPVQSGSDSVLKAMNRQHSAKDFELVAAAFRERFPDCGISTDVIVGFPGETEADFKQTLVLLERVKPDVTNISRFCPRPGTAAAKMKQTTTQVKKARSIESSALARRITLERNLLFVGREYRTVALEKARNGGVIGRAPNYKQLVFEGELGKEYEVRVVVGLQCCLKAEVI